MSSTYKYLLFKIFFLFFIFKQEDCAIYFPFKIINQEITNNNLNSPSLMKSWNYSQIFSELSIGSPPQKIGVFFVSNIYELNLFENLCDISTSYYSKDKSTTYNYIKSIKYIYNKVLNCSIINESIYLYTDKDQKNKITLDGINIIYSDNKKEDFKPNIYDKKEYEYHPNTCLNIGFRASQQLILGYDLNIVYQLKHYKINNVSVIQGYDFTFQYTNNDEGYLILGEKPHQFDPKNYHEEQYLSIGSKNTKYTSEWYLEFDNIYYNGIRMNDSSKYNSTFYTDNSVKFDMNFGLTEGTNNYENSIKSDFFNNLIDKKICFSEEVNDEYRFYYCDKGKSEDYIKKFFPTLNFCIRQFGFCFSFDYKDLFKEKDDKIYFLIYFRPQEHLFNRFTLGQMLIKKYSLTFNYDSKLIGFYDKNIKINTTDDENNGNDGNKSNVKLIVIFVVCLVVFIALGFLLGKLIYDKTRKKKANELIDDYDYTPQDINPS